MSTQKSISYRSNRRHSVREMCSLSTQSSESRHPNEIVCAKIADESTSLLEIPWRLLVKSCSPGNGNGNGIFFSMTIRFHARAFELKYPTQNLGFADDQWCSQCRAPEAESLRSQILHGQRTSSGCKMFVLCMYIIRILTPERVAQ